VTAALSQINFRDIGGVLTRDGAAVKLGVFYRSEGPAGFLDEHQAELRALGLSTVCDLRSKGERDAAPNTWCSSDCRILNVEMNTDVRASHSQDVWDEVRANPSSANLQHAINTSYRAMPYSLLPHIRDITLALIEGETPLLIHCTAGKDRTGFVVALFLSLLNVPDDVILADYAQSEPFMKNPRLRGAIEHSLKIEIGLIPSDEMIRIMTTIDKTHLLNAFAEISVRWNGTNGYFAAGNVDAAMQKRLRATMLR
jgi:protein-tyrosine phosphatase